MTNQVVVGQTVWASEEGPEIGPGRWAPLIGGGRWAPVALGRDVTDPKKTVKVIEMSPFDREHMTSC